MTLIDGFIALFTKMTTVPWVLHTSPVSIVPKYVLDCFINGVRVGFKLRFWREGGMGWERAPPEHRTPSREAVA